jgi:hypothetical protein
MDEIREVTDQNFAQDISIYDKLVEEHTGDNRT